MAAGNQGCATPKTKPALSKPKDAHTRPTLPRLGPRVKRGRIQKATPIANWASQPIKRKSMWMGNSTHTAG
jgi:hypothetical protein